MVKNLADNSIHAAKELWTGSTQELASSTIQRSSLAFDARLLNEGREPLINDGISMKVYASYATNCGNTQNCSLCK